MSGPSRRTAIKAFVGLGLASSLADCAAVQGPGGTPRPEEPVPDASGPTESAAVPVTVPEPAAAAERPVGEHDHPTAGDRFVFALGDREGQIVTPEDIPLGGPQLFAYPADVGGAHYASGRLDQVILLRVDHSVMSEETLARSARGIVAYSGICTHTGCEVSDWDAEAGRLVCPCHDSQFDPIDNATVVDGPAPRRLAALPVEIVDGDLRAAGGFVGRVGFQRR